MVREGLDPSYRSSEYTFQPEDLLLHYLLSAELLAVFQVNPVWQSQEDSN